MCSLKFNPSLIIHVIYKKFSSFFVVIPQIPTPKFDQDLNFFTSLNIESGNIDDKLLYNCIFSGLLKH